MGIDYEGLYPDNPRAAEATERKDAGKIYWEQQNESINIDLNSKPTGRELRLYERVNQSSVDPNESNLQLAQKVNLLKSVGYRRLEGTLFEEIEDKKDLGQALKDIYDKVHSYVDDSIVTIVTSPGKPLSMREAFDIQRRQNK